MARGAPRSVQMLLFMSPLRSERFPATDDAHQNNDDGYDEENMDESVDGVG
jgi:hypothetical protein